MSDNKLLAVLFSCIAAVLIIVAVMYNYKEAHLSPCTKALTLIDATNTPTDVRLEMIKNLDKVCKKND